MRQPLYFTLASMVSLVWYYQQYGLGIGLIKGCTNALALAFHPRPLHSDKFSAQVQYNLVGGKMGFYYLCNRKCHSMHIAKHASKLSGDCILYHHHSPEGPCMLWWGPCMISALAGALHKITHNAQNCTTMHHNAQKCTTMHHLQHLMLPCNQFLYHPSWSYCTVW